MTSERAPDEVYVWIWLPGRTDPVVAGRLSRDRDKIAFNYARSYLNEANRISIYDPELPLQPGLIRPAPALTMASAIRDASPDAWGRRVIMARTLGHEAAKADDAPLDELTYLLESGSDRIGALDFQASPRIYVPRRRHADLSELIKAAERVEQQLPLTDALAAALQHGTSLGGARPKVQINDNHRKFIAKFSAATDQYPVVEAEYVAMRLAALAGLNVAPVRLTKALGKTVLMVRRFDRMLSEDGWQRRAMVSALTLFELDEMFARYASYEDLCEVIRHRFTEPKATLRELFGRLAFNILCGNTDDHARNHAAFWDGQALELTPAYDLCPQVRAGGEASQAMLILGDRNASQVRLCIEAAPNFQLSRDEAGAIVRAQIAAIKANWDKVCDQASLAPQAREILWNGAFLKPYAVEGFDVGAG